MLHCLSIAHRKNGSREILAASNMYLFVFFLCLCFYYCCVFLLIYFQNPPKSRPFCQDEAAKLVRFMREAYCDPTLFGWVKRAPLSFQTVFFLPPEMTIRNDFEKGQSVLVIVLDLYILGVKGGGNPGNW